MMPKDGFASVTMPDSTYQILTKFKKQHDDWLRFQGIHSLTSMVSVLLTGGNKAVRHRFEEFCTKEWLTTNAE